MNKNKHVPLSYQIMFSLDCATLCVCRQNG